ncbi:MULTISPECIES: Asp23/Gls24 family envelope stress response protein [Enterococcus]|uniref:Asp23/Gls24 family envelope stress response protein n=1 Tax=Enterococcus TaxID=1350 RepID=UPI00032F10F9|nr:MULTISPECIES: Asp23/Gls24 family envelope stress response protein [Enterococcus]EGO2585309.1 Asp23/Gls24 family envelope stress response protein [Enterococcus faecalis]EGO2590717.1 Asp23/Gls24 family envelope stress response protein [Enterococcus faecalis]EGO2665892.1 Asp23/Gls24 family envelope stress response protein [Enterococcus faecalis]EGO2815889.1 Asp23/Gls24 family envelope stress response protein [Enterococcus faecalis]EGO2834774.1 Asp23/Gls24 family envelope stress response protei
MDNLTNNKKKDGEKKDTSKPIESVKGELVFEDKVIQKLIVLALDEIDGLLTIDGDFFSNIASKLVNTDSTTSGVDVEVGKKQVAADLSIVAEYGKDVTSIYEKMKQVISEEVKKMTGLDVIEVNVNVVDVKTKEQHEKDSVTLQDHLSDAASATGEFTSKQAEKTKEALGVASEKVNNSLENVKENVEDAIEPRVQ